MPIIAQKKSEIFLLPYFPLYRALCQEEVMCVLCAMTNSYLLFPLLLISLITTSLSRNNLIFTSGQGCGIEHEIVTRNIWNKNCTIFLSYGEPLEPSWSRKSNNSIFSSRKVATTVKDKEETNRLTIVNTVKDNVATQEVNAEKDQNKIETESSTIASTVEGKVETLQANITSSVTATPLEKMVTKPKTMIAEAFAEVIQSTASGETITQKPITMLFKDKAVKGKDKIDTDRSIIASTIKDKVETIQANTTPLRISAPSGKSANNNPSGTSTSSEKTITTPKTMIAAAFTKVIQSTGSGKTIPVKPITLAYIALDKSDTAIFAAGNVKMLYKDMISMCKKQGSILDKGEELGKAYQSLIEASSKYAIYCGILHGYYSLLF